MTACTDLWFTIQSPGKLSRLVIFQLLIQYSLFVKVVWVLGFMRKFSQGRIDICAHASHFHILFPILLAAIVPLESFYFMSHTLTCIYVEHQCLSQPQKDDIICFCLFYLFFFETRFSVVPVGFELWISCLHFPNAGVIVLCH